MGVKEQFDTISEKYDQQRRQLIPCFDDYYGLPLNMLDLKIDNPKILDIGCGTGLFSEFFMKAYPKAQFTLIDLSDKMLSVAKKRFEGNANIKYIAANYIEYGFQDKFDIIISALSIHHLSGEQKKLLYHKCYNYLNNGGVFINADQVLSPSSEIEDKFMSLWVEAAQRSELSDKELERAYERTSYDDPSPMEDQLKWLRQAGFQHLDILYKYYHFTVFYAKK